MWKGPKEFFTYSSKQRNGVLILIGLSVVSWIVYLFIESKNTKAGKDFSEFLEYSARWELEDSLKRLTSNSHSFFYFDPNTVSDSSLLELGLDARRIQTLINYRKKGGRFNKKKDLLNIYGMDTSWYQTIEPYVNIKTESHSTQPKQYRFKDFDINKVSVKELEGMGLDKREAKGIITFREKVHPFRSVNELFEVYNLDSSLVLKLIPHASVVDVKEEEEEVWVKKVLIELNTADTLELTQVKGLGFYFARRIVKFRNKLGGFYTKKQLLEVYGMDSVRWARIEGQIWVDTTHIKLLNLNTSTFKELLNHPYLDYELVKQIVEFREKVRAFKSVDEFRKLELVDEALFSKIAKYLRVD